MSKSANKMSGVPVTVEVRDKMRDFASGLNLTYSEMILYVLSQFIGEDEEPMIAGLRLRQDANKFITELERKADEGG